MYHSTEVESEQSFDTELLHNIAELFFFAGSGVCWLISLECYVRCLKFSLLHFERSSEPNTPPAAQKFNVM